MELLQRAVAEHQAGHFAEAAALYRQVVEVDASDANVWHFGGVAMYQAGQVEEALEYIERAIELNSQDADFYANLGNVLSSLDRPEDARQAYETSLQLSPRHVDAQLNLGLLHQRLGELDAAERCYRAVASVDDRNPAAHNNLGSLLRIRDRVDEALDCYRRALKNQPDFVPALVNMGNALLAMSRADEATQVLRRAAEIDKKDVAILVRLAEAAHEAGDDEVFQAAWKAAAHDPESVEHLGNLAGELHQDGQSALAAEILRTLRHTAPDHPLTWNNLGTILFELGNIDEAITCCRCAIALNPDYADAYRNLGTLLIQTRDLDDAILALRRAVDLSPCDRYAHHRLVALLTSQQMLEDAQLAIDHWLEKHPDDPLALHLRAACGGDETPSRASDDYIREEFDKFARRFDRQLAGLKYKAPEYVQAAVEECLPSGKFRFLDAGCGTGLCGPLVRERASWLGGVDLSGKMLERAEARSVYDELYEQELTTFLQGKSQEYDVIISADTLIYFGQLSDVSKAARGALRSGGWFVFTLEELAEKTNEYQLNGHGRYSHTEAYVRATLTDTGFLSVTCRRGSIRQEADRPVPGLIIAAQTP